MTFISEAKTLEEFRAELLKKFDADSLSATLAKQSMQNNNLPKWKVAEKQGEIDALTRVVYFLRRLEFQS